MKLLLAKKASVDAKSNAGWTPLHEAAYMGKTEAAALLLANQAEVNAKANNGQTSLHLAALHGYTEMVALLIANKAEINVQDDKKQTPLGAALDTNSLPKYLLPTALPGKKSAADLLRQAETGSAPK
jgi:ankyrin repeat protein